MSWTRRRRTSTSALVSYSSNTKECGNTYKISQIDSDLVSDYADDSQRR